MEKFSIILLWRLNHDKSHYLNKPITRNTFESVTKTPRKKRPSPQRFMGEFWQIWQQWLVHTLHKFILRGQHYFDTKINAKNCKNKMRETYRPIFLIKKHNEILKKIVPNQIEWYTPCLLYTSDAADDWLVV